MPPGERERKRTNAYTERVSSIQRGLLFFFEKTKNAKNAGKNREFCDIGFVINRNPKKWFCQKYRAPSDFCFSRPGKSTTTPLSPRNKPTIVRTFFSTKQLRKSTIIFLIYLLGCPTIGGRSLAFCTMVTTMSSFFFKFISTAA